MSQGTVYVLADWQQQSGGITGCVLKNFCALSGSENFSPKS